MEPSQRWHFIDALRGAAALAVVFFHLYMGSYIAALTTAMPEWIATVMHNGVLGVAVFFALSGFVIAHSLYGERATMGLIGRFALRRSIRLDPPYWVAIALSLCIAVLPALLSKDKPFPPISWGQVASHLVYLQDILQQPEINGVFWTLCLEVQFYLIYVALLAFSRNDPGKPFQGWTALIICGATLVSVLWATRLVTLAWSGSFLPLWYAWLIGAVAYWAWRNPVLAPFFGFVVSTITAAAIFEENVFAITSCATACALYFAAVTKTMGRLNWKWLQFLGMISYSLYLTHTPIMTGTFRLGYAITGRTTSLEAFWLVMAMAACISGATLLFFLVERPSMALARKIQLHNLGQRHPAHQHGFLRPKSSSP